MNINFDFPTELHNLGSSPSLEEVVPGHMEDAMQALLGEVKDAYQPRRMREAYGIEVTHQGEGVLAELTNGEAVVLESFIEGSGPHFPPWDDPDLVRWAEERGITPFLVARSVAEHGTPPHPQIDETVDSHAERLAQSVQDGIDEWVDRNF